MKLITEGHDNIYALTQTLISMLGIKPENGALPDDGGDCLLSSLSVKGTYATATARLRMHGGESLGRARAYIKGLEPPERERACQHALVIAAYKAIKSRTGADLPWGSLSGVRPAKLAVRLSDEGLGRAGTARVLRKRYFVSPERTALVMAAAERSMAVRARFAPQDIMLYVGIPFCPTRCSYCSFVSHEVGKYGYLIEPYLETLLYEAELSAEALRAAGARIRAVYIGGGTPTTLSAEQLGRLMDKLRQCFDLSQLLEYTVEAGRPDTITPEKLQVMSALGADRVSVNPQSMSAEVLAYCARPHSPEEVVRAVEEARAAGFKTINTDLIAGLRGDDPARFKASLEGVLALRPENITVHTLALKRGADLKEGRPADGMPDSRAVSEMLSGSLRALPDAGYSPYYLYRQKYMAGGFENVGWTLPGHECLYNIGMMEELLTIVSLGAGGVTKLIDAKKGTIRRVTNKKYPKEYIEDRDKLKTDSGVIGAFITDMLRGF